MYVALRAWVAKQIYIITLLYFSDKCFSSTEINVTVYTMVTNGTHVHTYARSHIITAYTSYKIHRTGPIQQNWSSYHSVEMPWTPEATGVFLFIMSKNLKTKNKIEGGKRNWMCTSYQGVLILSKNYRSWVLKM